MPRLIMVSLIVILAAACSTFRGTPQPATQAASAMPDRYVVFFSPRTAELGGDAQQVVRLAAIAVQKRKPSRIEIAVPPEAPRSSDLVEGRYTAIQNIIAATGVDSKLYARAVLSADAMNLPGGNDRAEIRLIP
jgi:hypothetical protein